MNSAENPFRSLIIVLFLGMTAGCASQNLISAAGVGDLFEVKTLIDTKADVNIKNDNGATALVIASNKGHKEIVQALIDAKADVNAKTNNGATALFVASGNGHKEIVQALIDAKADVNIKNDDGGTALMAASGNGHKEIVQALIDAKADVNIKADNGGTALICATLFGHKEVVKLLIDAKADVNAKDKKNATALMYASGGRGQPDIVQLLRNAGAKSISESSPSVSSPLSRQSRQKIERKGEMELVVVDGLPVPILKSEQGSYILDVTPQSNLPPGMVVDGMVGWRPGASFSVKGYVSGKKGTIWNSEKRTIEEAPVLHVLTMTEF